MDERLVGDIIGKVFEIGDAYRRENAILRTLLLERGLSRQQIDGEIRKHLRRQRVRELADKTLERISSILADYFEKTEDSAKQKLIAHLETDRSKMN